MKSRIFPELTLHCRLCQSDNGLEEQRFEKGGRFWICTRCYNNALLREQIRGRFERLFSDLVSGDASARDKISALARQYKLPEPDLTGI
ncbi:MAG: hypothetical protein HY587_04405 [Candidatus Omnitrophica bacterium]|nr:hypothetical protein [Candidatus Omnitrophota bacterium]